jgi:hypothetical protein
MFAVSLTVNDYKTSYPYLSDELQINAYYYTQTKIQKNIKKSQEKITLEKCTPSHFSRV